MIKNQFFNNYRAYIRMKNKMAKTQHNSLYTLTKHLLSFILFICIICLFKDRHDTAETAQRWAPAD